MNYTENENEATIVPKQKPPPLQYQKTFLSNNPLSPTLEVKSPTTPNEINSLIPKPEEPKPKVNEQEEEKIEGLEDFDEGVNSKFGNIYISILLNVLFILSFLMEYRIGTTNEMNFALQKQIDDYPFYLNPVQTMQNIQSLDDANSFIYNVFLINVIYSEGFYTPTNYNNTLSIEVGTDTNSSNKTARDAGYGNDYQDQSKYRFLNFFNMFKGLNLSYSYAPESDTSITIDGYIFLGTKFNLNQTKQALNKLNTLAKLRVVSLNLEAIFFNIIDQIGIYYKYNFEQDSSGTFKKSKRSLPFYPKTFDSDYAFPTAKTLILVFRILFALSLFLQLITTIALDVYRTIKRLFQTHRLFLPFSLIFDLSLCALLIVVTALSFYNSAKQSGTCETLGLVDEKKFESFRGYAEFQNFFVRLLSIVVIFLASHTLLLLNTQFPTFGILFHAIGRSKQSLVTYGLMIITFMIGFVILLTFNFGHQDTDMSSFLNAFYLNFEFMIGTTNHSKLEKASPSLSGIYFFIFYIIFNLLVLLLFNAIIMSTYVQMRSRLQLTTLALTELATERSKDLKNKYIKLFLCQPPEDDHQAKNKGGSDRVKKRNLIEVLLYNLEEIEWFGLRKRYKKTRDEIEDEIKKKVAEIKKRRLEKEKNKIHQRTKSLRSKLMNFVVHLVFIIIYISAISLQLQEEASFELNESINEYLANQTFSSQSGAQKAFADLATLDDIIDWTSKVYLNSIFFNYTTSSSQTTILPIYNHNKIISSAVSRVNIRNLGVSQIIAADENQTTFYVRSTSDISPATKTSPQESSETIIFSDGFETDYLPSGTHTTFRKNGGYVFALIRDKSDTQTQNKYIQNPKLLNINTGLISLQTVYMNANYDILGLAEFTIEIKSSGSILTKYNTKTFQVNMYTCQGCYKKAILEIICLLFILKQAYSLAKEWSEEWQKEESQKLTPLKEEFREENCLTRFLNYNIKEWEFVSFFQAVFTRLQQILYRLIITTLMFFRRNSANFILTLSTLLSFCCFYFYLRIIFDEFRRDVDLNSEPNVNLSFEDQMVQIGKYEQLAFLVDTYKILQAITSWLVIIRLLFEFGFSREISFLIDIVYEALLDILFFILTFAIILLGFAVGGFLMFGAITTEFKDLGLAYLQSLLWMVSGKMTFSSSDKGLDSGTQAVFFILLTIVGLLILLKMFMALIDGQYMDSISTAITEEHSNLFKVVIILIKERYKQEEEAAENFHKEKANPEKQPKQGLLKKINATFSSWQKQIRYNIILRLMRFVLADKKTQPKSKNKTPPPQMGSSKKKFIINLPAEDDPRASDLEDIQLYLKQEYQKEFEQIPEVIEDELTMPHYWMNYLEDTLSQSTEGRIKLGPYAIGAQDFLNIDSREHSEFQAKFKEDFELLALKDDPLAREEFLQKFVEEKAIPFYQKAQDQESVLLEVSNYLKFIYKSSLKDTLEEPGKSTEFAKDSSFQEDMFDYSNESLYKFWNSLKFQHQYQLWAGDKAHLLSNNIRHCLWVQMKFNVNAFQPLIIENEFAFRHLHLKHIGMKELEFIWQKKLGASERKDSQSSFDDESQDPTQVKTNKKHINFIENFIRGKNSNLIVELQKLKTIQEKVKFLQSQKHTCQDPKLMLWLVSPLSIKAEIVSRIQNPTLLQFTMLMLFEEVYDNFNILTRVEDQFERDFINKIYMFYFYLSQFEALQEKSKLIDTATLKKRDPDLISYIAFLERQIESTNNIKREYLDEIEEILKNETPKQYTAPVPDASTFRVVTLVTESDEGAFFMKTAKIGHEEFIFNEEDTKEEDLESFRPPPLPKEQDKENMAQPLPQSSIHSQRQKRKTQAQAQAPLSEINLDSNIELTSIAELRKKRKGMR